MSYRYGIFSWWWAHSCPKHVEKSNKHIKKICAPSWFYLQKITQGWRSTTHKKSNINWFYHTFLFNYLYTECILVISHHTDYGHKSEQNILVKNNNNNMWLNIFINVHLLAYHISSKFSLMHGYGTHEAHKNLLHTRTIQVTNIEHNKMKLSYQSLIINCFSSCMDQILWPISVQNWLLKVIISEMQQGHSNNKTTCHKVNANTENKVVK